MKKYNTLFAAVLVLALALMSGCGSSDETTSDAVKSRISLPSSASVKSETPTIAVDSNVSEVPPLVINGYTLPPEPDPKINNSTLLGIDSNNNGVRDDVERWIYIRYDTHIPCIEKKIDVTLPNGKVIQAYEKVCEDEAIAYHQIVREIAMQGARTAQIIIQEPKRARETTKLMDAAQGCNTYFSNRAKSYNEPILLDHTILIDDEFNNIQFNTVQRARAYGRYNFALSGGVYRMPTDEAMRAGCDFNVDALLGKE